VYLLVAAAVGVTAAAASGSHGRPGWQAGTATGAGLDAGTLDTLDRDLAAGKYGIVDSIQVFAAARRWFTGAGTPPNVMRQFTARRRRPRGG